LARVSQQAPANSTSTAVSSAAFPMADLYSLTVTADALIIGVGTSVGAFDLFASSKAPSDPLSPAKRGGFVGGACGAHGAWLQPGSAALFVGCISDAGSFQTILRAPLVSGWPSQGTLGMTTQVVSGSPINAQTFLVRGNSVYFTNESVPGLFG